MISQWLVASVGAGRGRAVNPSPYAMSFSRSRIEHSNSPTDNDFNVLGSATSPTATTANEHW